MIISLNEIFFWLVNPLIHPIASHLKKKKKKKKKTQPKL